MTIQKTFLHFSATVLALTLSFSSFSCKSPTEPTPTKPKIETGTELIAATQTVSNGGGTIRVTSPDTLINGLVVEIPDNSYPDARTFTISYAPITSNDFGEFFRPISPLITISNGGGYADSMMTVKVPISLPDSAYPVAFFYDDKNQSLEPVPMLTYDKHSVTVMSMHFDLSGISPGNTKSGGLRPTGAITDYARLLILMVNKKIVAAIGASQPVIATGYYPGTDDWEFINYGSYLSRGGHCAGQNSSSLWYYYEKKRKLSEPALFHRFDSVNISASQLWQDNPLGYRAATGMQRKMDWDAIMLKFYEEYLGAYDDWSWDALVLAMYEIREPFDIGVYGLGTGGSRIGHDLTAYKIDVPSGTVYVADPNYPGDMTRKIIYNGSTFNPYYSGPTAADPGHEFRTIKFTSKTAVIKWTAMGEVWNNVVVNRQNPGFPAYHLRVINGGFELATDNITSNIDTLIMGIDWAEANRVCFQAFNRSGTRLIPKASSAFLYSLGDTIFLKPGDNLIGFAVFGEVPPTPPATTAKYYWNDFRWIHINYSKTQTRIEPASMTGVKNQQYIWSGIVTNRPAGTRYEWDFGDGTSKFIRTNDSVAYHSYTSDGDRKIRLEIYNTSSGLRIDTAIATASIHSGVEITSLWPTTVSFAQDVHISGKNFGAAQGSSSVLFDIFPAYAIVSWSSTEIVAKVPESFDGGNVVVTVGGVSSVGMPLRSRDPSISSVIPDSAYPGDVIKIRGIGFGELQGRASVDFNGLANAGVVSWSDTSVEVIVPEPASYGTRAIWLTVGKSASDYFPNFKILEDVLRTVKEMKCFQNVFYTGRLKKYYSNPPREVSEDGSVTITQPKCSLSGGQWSGNSFSQTVTDNSLAGTTKVTTVSGTVSDDGRMIVNFHAKYVYTRAEYGETIEFDLTNIPLDQTSAHSYVWYHLIGQSIQGHVTKIVDEKTKNGVVYEKFLDIDWSDQVLTKGLYISLSAD